jgi:predicted alpha/beta superfamily hydrolase
VLFQFPPTWGYWWNRLLRYCFLLFCAFLPYSLYSQVAKPTALPHIPTRADEITISNSFKRDLASKANGITYHLTVFLPRGYDPAKEQRYPVFYFIPGGPFGVYVSEISKYLASGDIPKLIVVGVDFPPDDSYSMDLPSAGHDSHWDVPANRGAQNFLHILLAEIKPYIDANFPTVKDDTGIGGHSLGGFFALYALLHAPDSFQHVYASSPSLVWQDFVLLRDEQALSTRAGDINARVFVDRGGLESDDHRLDQLTQSVQARHYPSLEWTSRTAIGQTHQTVAFADGIDALYSIYGPVLRHPSYEELRSLGGTYETSDGKSFRVQADHDHLYAIGFRTEEPDSAVELISSKPNEWFIRYLWTRIVFNPAAKQGPDMTIYLQDTPGPNGKTDTPVLTARRKRAAEK